VYEALELIAKLAILLFVVSSMAAMGLSLAVRDILAPLGRVRMVLLALVANFVAAPLLAYLLTQVIPLRPSHAVGLLLLGGAAGAPFLPKLAEQVRGDLALAVALTILLMVASAVFMPLVLPLVIPGLHADFWGLIQPLLVQMLAPLAAGILLKRYWSSLAVRLKPLLVVVTNLTLVLVLVLLFGLNFRSLLHTIGSGAIAVAIVFVGITFVTGYLLAPDAGSRPVLGLATGQRNIAAALVTASACYPNDPEVVIMLLVVTFAGVAVLLVAARYVKPAELTP
jgi:BASS family bile acid:Na+ symporter